MAWAQPPLCMSWSAVRAGALAGAARRAVPALGAEPCRRAQVHGDSRSAQCWCLEPIANIIQTIPIIIAPQTSAPEIARIGRPKMAAITASRQQHSRRVGGVPPKVISDSFHRTLLSSDRA